MEENQNLKIDIRTLRRAAERLFDELEIRYPEVDLTDRAWYWEFISPGRYEFPAPSTSPAIGDLNDDWAELTRISDEQEVTSLFADLEHLGNLLCAISDETAEAT